MEHLQKGLPPAAAGPQNLVRVEPHLTALSGSCTLMDKHSSGGPKGHGFGLTCADFGRATETEHN